MKFKYNIGDAVKVDNSQSYYRIDSILITEHKVYYNLSRIRDRLENELDFLLLERVTEDRLGHRQYNKTPYQSPRGDIRCNLTGDQN